MQKQNNHYISRHHKLLHLLIEKHDYFDKCIGVITGQSILDPAYGSCSSCFWVQALAVIAKHGRNVITTTISAIPAAIFSIQKIIANVVTQHKVEKSIPAWI